MAFELNLQTETVRLIRSDTPPKFAPDASIRQVLDAMQEQRRGCALICDTDDRLIGIFTERDALQLMARRADLDQKIETVMSKPDHVSESATVADAIRCMFHGGYRRVPIVDADGRPTGIVKTAEILHYIVQHFPESVYNLPPNPDHTSKHREGA